MPDNRSHGDHAEYFGMARRVIRAAGKRAGSADPEDLAPLAALSLVVDVALHEAVMAQREAGFSWAQIGNALGMTRQSAQERFGRG